MPNPVVHFEIGCRDTARTQQLYRELFDWEIEASEAGTIAGAGIGGHIASLGHEPFNYTIFYVQVDDVEAHVAKAQGLGCDLVAGPFAFPRGTLAWIGDPEGNTIGLFTPAEQSRDHPAG